MDEQRADQTDNVQKWGRFFGFLAGGVLLGLVSGNIVALGLLGALIGLVAALSVSSRTSTFATSG